MEIDNGEDDSKLDIEAMNDKATELKKLEELSFDQEAFEDIERDFKQFLEEIVGNNNLKKFRMEYQGIYKALVASHKNEQALINDCKVMIGKIWDNAQNVKSAIRMAANEVDKITELQRRVKDEQSKVASRREEEDDKRGTIAVLQAEISALDKKALEHHELEE